MPSTAPPPRRQTFERRRDANRPPTAALPPGALERRVNRREVSAVPPTTGFHDASDPRNPGVAAALVPEAKAQRGRSREDLVRFSVVIARIVALLGAYGLPRLFDVRPASQAMLALAVALTIVRTIRPARGRIEQAAEIAVVAVMLFTTGGLDGPFALFGVATAFASGVAVGIAGGLLGATVLVFGGIGAGFEDLFDDRNIIDLATLVPWLSLYPMGAVLGGLLGHVLVDSRSSQALLVEANRVLGSLERLATAAPETLSPARVATTAAAQFRRALDGDIAFVLSEREGTLLELGRDGTVDAGAHLVLDQGWQDLVAGTGPTRLVESALPQRLTRQLPALPKWTAIPLRSREINLGVVLVGGDLNDHRSVRPALAALAAETAVALDNTQLFSKVEHAAAAAERERLASDLHDGVAQHLTHVRFELELLAREAADDRTRGELGRLARVASRASDDVRSAIRGLRAQALDEGLVPAIRSLVNDLDGAGGPTLELSVLGAAELDADVTAELYRIVQEALSNALRHAHADTINVNMDVIEGTLVLEVEDDGRGLDGVGSADGDGMGLRTMRSRARRIGASFSLDEGDEGGARMQLRLPLTQENV